MRIPKCWKSRDRRELLFFDVRQAASGAKQKGSEGVVSFVMNRRSFIRSLAGTSLLLPGMLSELMASTEAVDPIAPRASHFPPRAKRVIFLHMSGGVSHVDSFDPKPKLVALRAEQSGPNMLAAASVGPFTRIGGRRRFERGFVRSSGCHAKSCPR